MLKIANPIPRTGCDVPTWLHNLNWRTAHDQIRSAERVFVPIGAISKEHGPHLPLNTDYLIAEAFIQRLSKHTNVVSTPVVSFGYYPAFEKFPGSFVIEDCAFRSIISSILRNLIASGANEILILNTGLSTTHELIKVIRSAHENYKEPDVQNQIHSKARKTPILLTNILDLFNESRKILDIDEDLRHADRLEISLMLAINPDLVTQPDFQQDYPAVSLDKRKRVITSPLALDPFDKASPSYNPTGIIGNALEANVQLGNELLNTMVKLLVDELTNDAH